MEHPVQVKRLVFDIKEGFDGIKSIAFVDEPAIMKDMVKFQAEELVRFAIQDEERRIVLSPVLIPDLHIPRVDKKTGVVYAVTMDRATVLEAALRWQQEGRYSFANEMHDENRQLEGITWFNPIVTDEQMFGNPASFPDLPIGTFFIAGKVNDDQVWDKIKKQEYRGISMEGFFKEVPDVILEAEQIDAITQSIINN